MSLNQMRTDFMPEDRETNPPGGGLSTEIKFSMYSRNIWDERFMATDGQQMWESNGNLRNLYKQLVDMKKSVAHFVIVKNLWHSD